MDENNGTGSHPVATDAGASAPDPAQAMETLQSLFSTLVPPDRIQLTDALGNEYSLRAVLPARAQITIMQHLQRLWDADVPGLDSMATGGAAGMAGALVALAANPIILDGLCDAFAAAHPGVVAKAAAAAAAAAAADGDMDPPLDDPASLFPLEELVAGLIPFFIRFAARASDLMGQVTGPTAETATA